MTRWIQALVAALATLMLAAPAAQAACRIGTAGATQKVDLAGRSILVHIPAGFDPAKRHPLLFLLHGSGGTGAQMLARSKLAATSDAHGFILAAPDGGIPVPERGGFVWNIPGVPTVTGKVPTAQDADDVAYIGAAIDQLVGQACVDKAQVYVTGLSGGGRMSSWLGCVAADRFAAIAPVVGLRAGNPSKGDPQTPDPATCRPSRPVPVIAFAGDKDTTNPIEGGGTPYWQYPMHAAEQRWAQLNGCKGALQTRDVTPAVYEERYAPCRAGAEVVARITRGGVHDWVVDNEAMWAFLTRYRRN
ncbi:MAG TPA: PHB depolymerase family esterase [Phenylobacterium sp.]